MEKECRFAVGYQEKNLINDTAICVDKETTVNHLFI